MFFLFTEVPPLIFKPIFYYEIYLPLFLSALSLTSFAHNEPWTASRPDGHAPLTVMGDHMHAMGEWMVSYRYMTMDMQGLLKGSDSVQPTMADTSFMPAMLPKDMTMDMHMFGLCMPFLISGP